MTEPLEAYSELSSGSGEQGPKEEAQFSLTEENLNEGAEKISHGRQSRESQQPQCDSEIHEIFQGHSFDMASGSCIEMVKPTIACSIVDFQRRTLLKEKANKMMRCKEKALLHCPLCSCFYVAPITLTCGHTLCKDCILSDNVDQILANIDCKQCGSKSNIQQRSVNVLVTYLIQKWFPHEYESEVKKLEDIQRGRLQNGEQRKVVETLSGVLKNSPLNFKALKWRSQALYQMGMFGQALKDAELACMLRPFLPQAFYQRGLISVAMDNHEEAALNFGRCVALDSTTSEYYVQLLSSLTEVLRSERCVLGKEGIAEHYATELTSERSKNTENKVCNESESDNIEKNSRVLKSTKSIISSNPSSVRSDSYQGKQTDLKRPSEKCTLSSTPENTFPSKRVKLSNLNAGETFITRKEGDLKQESITTKCEDSMQESIRREKDDLTCEICYSVLFQPVTTTCGHTFCRDCLQRSLDFKPDCPYCRQPLDCVVARNYQVTNVIKEITEKLFPDEYAARESWFAKEKASWKGCGVDDSVDVPIFVCMLAFPSLKYPLHIYEPRYRLMIRRCVELGSRMFGMCMSDPDCGFSEYGTMLYIENMEALPDGRCIIQTTARRRFRVISRDYRDGYNTAKVEWLDDEIPTSCTEERELEALNNDCGKLLELWFNSLTQVQQNCITNAIGPMPRINSESPVSSPDGSSWEWWALAAIPLQDKAKLIILSMKSLEERLRSIRRFLELLISMSSGNDLGET